MSKLCHEGMCQGPQSCWLKAYLENPGPRPSNHPELEPDDVNAARRMTRCSIRKQLKKEYPRIFRQAAQPKK